MGFAAAFLTGGGLIALQTAAITTGLPFAIVLLVMCFGLYRSFKKEMPAKQSQVIIPMPAKQG